MFDFGYFQSIYNGLVVQSRNNGFSTMHTFNEYMLSGTQRNLVIFRRTRANIFSMCVINRQTLSVDKNTAQGIGDGIELLPEATG